MSVPERSSRAFASPDPGRLRMRPSMFLLLLSLCGCHDFGENGLSTGPRPRDTPGRVIITDNLAFDYWMRLSPEERQSALRTMQEVYAEQGQSAVGGHIAVMDGNLPNGASALIVQ